MADKKNILLMLPRIKALVRYLGDVEFKLIFPSSCIGSPIHQYSGVWKISDPDNFYVTETYDRYPKKTVKEIVVPAKGAPFDYFIEELNRRALQKAKEEFLEEATKDYLQKKLIGLELL